MIFSVAWNAMITDLLKRSCFELSGDGNRVFFELKS